MAAALTWVGVISLTVAVIVMLRGLAATGGVIAPKVIAVNGYANRFLVISYRVWVAAAASAAGAPGDG